MSDETNNSKLIMDIKEEIFERFKPATQPIPSMYSDETMDLNDSFVIDPKPSSPSDPDLVMPARRPTAVSMISNKRKVSARITQKFSPYMLNHLQQRGVLTRLENEAIELPYNENMARIKPQKVKSDVERAQRDRNNVASRQSRLKAKMLEEELQNEARNVEEENRRQKIKVSMYRVYVNALLQKFNKAQMDLDIAWEKEQASSRPSATKKPRNGDAKGVDLDHDDAPAVEGDSDGEWHLGDDVL